MKAFLLSDLVVHELVSMQLEGKWLTPAQFSESARLWTSRHASQDKVSEESLSGLEREALRIAQKLLQEGNVKAEGAPLKTFFLDIPVVNYAEPMSARALAASLEACRERLCHYDSCSSNKDRDAQANKAGEFVCHPTARGFFCALNTAPRRESC